MPQEIERKYLVTNDQWKDLPCHQKNVLVQGYLSQASILTIEFTADAGLQLCLAAADNSRLTQELHPVANDLARFRGVRTLPVYDPDHSQLLIDGNTTLRFRTASSPSASSAFLTIKYFTGDPEINHEYEIAVPYKFAQQALARCCPDRIEKVRHLVSHDGQQWEVDVFGGALAGLVIAEIEVADQSDFANMKPLPGAAENITALPGINNRDLARYGLPGTLQCKIKQQKQRTN